MVYVACPIQRSHRGIFLATGWVESRPTQNRWQTQARRKEGCFPIGRKPGLITERREKTKRKGRCLCLNVCASVCVCVYVDQRWGDHFSDFHTLSLCRPHIWKAFNLTFGSDEENKKCLLSCHHHLKATIYHSKLNQNNDHYGNCFPVLYYFSLRSWFSPY